MSTPLSLMNAGVWLTMVTLASAGASKTPLPCSSSVTMSILPALATIGSTVTVIADWPLASPSSCDSVKVLPPIVWVVAVDLVGSIAMSLPAPSISPNWPALSTRTR